MWTLPQRHSSLDVAPLEVLQPGVTAGPDGSTESVWVTGRPGGPCISPCGVSHTRSSDHLTQLAT